MTTRLRVLLPILLGIAPLSVSRVFCAEPLPPVAYPQWSTVFPREQLADDSIAPSAGPSWTRLPGGDTAVVTAVGTGLLIRRFAADGSVRAVQFERLGDPGNFDFVDELITKTATTGDGIYVLAGSYQGRCQIMRFDGDLHREWSTTVPASDLFIGQCRDFEVLADDSVLTLRESSLARIGDNGQVLWTIKHGDGDHWFYAADLAVDANGTIWVASRGGPLGSSGNQASVLRFDMSGALLSTDDFLCATCIASYSMSVDALPDGSIIVGGGSGSGQPGFFARYAPDGQRLLLVDTESDVRYAHLAHDLAGFVYARTDGATSQVRRIDEQTGAVLWATPADEFTALDSGIATIRTTASGIEVAALDASGAPRWSRIVSPEADARASRGVSRNGNLEMLVLDSWPSSPTCGRSPRLITLDGSGNLIDLLHACTMPGAAMLDSIDAQPGIGVLANLGYRLIAYSPDGDVRWQVTTCEWCSGFGSGDPRWVAATLTADGGAWAAERTLPLPPFLVGSLTIKRIDASGQIDASLATAAQAASIPAIRLLGATHDAIVLQPTPANGVTWQLVSDDGTGLGPYHYSMPDNFFDIDDARRQIDGTVTLVTTSVVICGTGCNPRYVTVMRLGADGNLSWRYQFPEYDAIVALADDGSTLAVLSRPTDGVPMLRGIATDGSVSISVPIEGVPSFVQLSQLIGPIDGHWLLHTQGGFPWEDALWLIDNAGHVVASQRNSPYVWILGAGIPGYLVEDVSEDSASTALLDPASLAVRARLAFTATGTPYDDFGATWSMLDDGSVYGSALTHREDFTFEKLARFSLPGTPLSNLIFRDSFD